MVVRVGVSRKSLKVRSSDIALDTSWEETKEPKLRELKAVGREQNSIWVSFTWESSCTFVAAKTKTSWGVVMWYCQDIRELSAYPPNVGIDLQKPVKGDEPMSQLLCAWRNGLPDSSR